MNSQIIHNYFIVLNISNILINLFKKIYDIKIKEFLENIFKNTIKP